jgi:hypothetical protein
VLSLVACVALILLVVGLIFAFASDFVDSRGFDQKWPPLSDEEFLSRCPPGTTRETALRVRTIVSEQAGIPREQIYPEQRFVGDLDC